MYLRSYFLFLFTAIHIHVLLSSVPATFSFIFSFVITSSYIIIVSGTVLALFHLLSFSILEESLETLIN